MKSLSVAGGFYREVCASPAVDDAYGSGGRAAIALALAGAAVEWHYYCPTGAQLAASLQVNHPNLTHRPTASSDTVSFRYFHPLSRPIYSPRIISPGQPIQIKDEVILRFGFMEGDAVVQAKKCVYDPQSPEAPTPFKQNGSCADDLAIVLNAREVLAYGGSSSELEAVQNIQRTDGAAVILVKAGIEGCRVYEGGVLIGVVPPYWSNRIYKIGTGDVFSAAFTYQWAIMNLSPFAAADIASRCVAHYAESRTPIVDLAGTDNALRSPLAHSQNGRVYIAGPFFTMSELWLIEEAYAAFVELGVEPFSPYHHVGLGPPEAVVEPDLNGLRGSTAVFAVLDGCDPGTIFEIGYAVKHGLPVVALSQNPKEADQTMLLGSPNCFITNDFATAIYHTAWKARA